jgi:hypothetical protein
MSGPVHRCLFCGGDALSPQHLTYCDGRQGAIDAGEPALPRLIAGLVPETYATSSEAAARVESTRDTQRAEVLAAIRQAGPRGATDDELQAALGLDGSSERPRRWELWKLDRIQILRDATGAEVKRLTRTSRRAVVWICTEPALR